MTRISRVALATLATIVLPATFTAALPATAAAQTQDTETIRRTYTFLGDRLSVRVDGAVPGTLRVIRGESGRIEVAGRVRHGLAGFGLSSRNGHVLHLTAVGGEHADYILVVPDAVRVEVRLPGNPVAEVIGTFQDAASFRWGTTER